MSFTPPEYYNNVHFDLNEQYTLFGPILMRSNSRCLRCCYCCANEDVNLEDARDGLIQLLEQYVPEDCMKCNRIKCNCASGSTSPTSSVASTSSSNSSMPQERDRSMDIFYNVAPPPESLPKPKWPGNKTVKPNDENETSIVSINKWIKASLPFTDQPNNALIFPVVNKVYHEINYSWPPSPNSIWSKETLNSTVTREALFGTSRNTIGNGSVEAFFRHFGRDRPLPESA